MTKEQILNICKRIEENRATEEEICALRDAALSAQAAPEPNLDAPERPIRLDPEPPSTPAPKGDDWPNQATEAARYEAAPSSSAAGPERHNDCKTVCQRSISRGGECIGGCDLLQSTPTPKQFQKGTSIGRGVLRARTRRSPR